MFTQPTTRKRLAGRLALFIALLLVIVGAKFRLIDRYGSDLPYWDQWDAEGDRLIRPYLEGQLTVGTMFSPHNEHRPAFTRVLSLALFELDDRQWDGRVQQVVNAFLHTAMALLLLGLAWRALGPPGAILLGALTALLFSTGISWENTVAGFQSQFYFALLFSALQMAGMLLARPRSRGWWLAPLAGVGALFSMASGPLAAMAIIAALAVRVIRDRRLTREDVWLFGVNAVLTVAGLLLKVDVPGHAPLKAAGAVAWLVALLHQFAWPVGFPWACVLGIVPPVLLLIAYFRRRVDGPIPLLLLGACGWAALEAAATAYARGAENFGYSSRYFDSLAIGVLVNFVTLLYLLRCAAPGWGRRWLAAGTACFVAAVVWGLTIQIVEADRLILHDLPHVNDARIANVSAYVARHDPAFFGKSPWDELPYPDSHRLAQLLDTPVLRESLPFSVRPPIPLTPDEHTQGFNGLTPGAGADGAAPSKNVAAVPRSTPPPHSLTAWCSEGTNARFESQPFVAQHTRVTLFVSGENLAADRVVLVDAAGREHAPLGSLGHGGHWKQLNFSVPHGTYRLVAVHAGAGWLAFTQPLVNAPLSIAAARIVTIWPWLLALGTLVTAAAILLLRPVVAPRPASRRDYASAAAALALALPLIGALLMATHRWQRPVSAVDPAAIHVTSFGLADAASPAQPDPQFIGGAFVLAGNVRDWLGTFVGGDGFTGRLVSTPFRLEGPTLHVPIIGYPALAGNSLQLEILDPAGRSIATIRYSGPDPREYPGVWDVPVGAYSGRTARLVLTDGLTTARGWLAVGAPTMRNPGASWLYGVTRDYGWYAVIALAVASLLFLPGLAARTRWPGEYPTGTAFLPVPGVVLLALFGLMTWLGGAGSTTMLAPWWLVGHLLLAAWLAVRWWRDGGPLSRDEVRELSVYASVAIAALAFGVLPMDVAQESARHSTYQGRMIASPPDHTIPYRTAVYFYFGKSGREDRAIYFGNEWSAASRGPVAPFIDTALFPLFGTEPHDPPGLAIDGWPATTDAFHLARIAGILTNALVLLAGALVARRLHPRAGWIALCWLAVSPVVAINVDFIWPKLLATFFLMLALDANLARRGAGWAGVWIALGYLSHPVGGLFAVPLITFIAHRTWTESTGTPTGRTLNLLSRLAALGAVILVSLAPWLAYKAWLGFPDAFAQYPLGDGHGFSHAASIASWIRCRTDNLWLTLAPTAFYFSGFMRAWIEGPLNDPLRWALGYAKSLPGEVGIVGFIALAIAFVRRPPNITFSQFRLHLLLGAFALLLLFWGFSRDGLGRNCLEPLAVLAIVYAAAMSPDWRGWRWVVVITALEALSVRVIGVVCAPGFTVSSLNAEAITLAIITVVGAVAPALWLMRGRAPVDPR